MADIIHRIGIACAADKIFELLTTDAGRSRWWTTDTSGAGSVGSTIKFRFNGIGPDFEVVELRPDSLVRWRHSGEVPDAWMGIEISFRLTHEHKQTYVLLRIPTGAIHTISWAIAAPNEPYSC